MITFETQKNETVIVRLEKKIVGEIRIVEGGYQYFPKGKKTGGEIFKSLASCKNSLTEE